MVRVGVFAGCSTSQRYIWCCELASSRAFARCSELVDVSIHGYAEQSSAAAGMAVAARTPLDRMTAPVISAARRLRERGFAPSCIRLNCIVFLPLHRRWIAVVGSRLPPSS